ncbi:MAG: hypothetical protein FWG90_12385 [Oscillospiraceae bacterium]|nr:hypothetical protein [Oscillospiraceae bacterium]
MKKLTPLIFTVLILLSACGESNVYLEFEEALEPNWEFYEDVDETEAETKASAPISETEASTLISETEEKTARESEPEETTVTTQTTTTQTTAAITEEAIIETAQTEETLLIITEIISGEGAVAMVFLDRDGTTGKVLVEAPVGVVIGFGKAGEFTTAVSDEDADDWDYTP